MCWCDPLPGRVAPQNAACSNTQPNKTNLILRYLSMSRQGGLVRNGSLKLLLPANASVPQLKLEENLMDVEIY
jgi:hypothetical protein